MNYNRIPINFNSKPFKEAAQEDVELYRFWKDLIQNENNCGSLAHGLASSPSVSLSKEDAKNILEIIKKFEEEEEEKIRTGKNRTPSFEYKEGVSGKEQLDEIMKMAKEGDGVCLSREDAEKLLKNEELRELFKRDD